jgi:hypothetical protein
MVNIIILIAFILYFGYNIVQVSKAMSIGASNKELFKLFLFAAPIKLWNLLKK